MRNWRTAVLAAAMVAAGAATASAQESELVTDRPDFTESSAVVGRGVVQFESGFSYERSGTGVDRVGSITAPGSLARIGLSRRVELRLGADGVLSEAHGAGRSTGMADMEVGLKIRLLNQDAAGLDVAVIPMASLPTGAAGVTSGGVDPTVKLTWARDLPAGFGLSGNYNVASLSSEPGRFAQRALSVSLGHDLFGAWGGYIEGYGFSPMDRGAGSGWTLDGGVSRRIGANLQFDVEVGRGLTPDAADWSVGFGFAIREHLGPRR